MSKRKAGSEWTKMIYFYPWADETQGEVHPISDEELVEQITQLTDADEDIQEVAIYEEYMAWWQLTRLVYYHTFVLFETRKYYWSIEKNSEGITLQRSKYKSAVKDKFRQEARESLRLVQEDHGRKTIEELIEMLYRKDELNNKYSYLTSNCKHFTKVVYDFTARHDTMSLGPVGRVGRAECVKTRHWYWSVKKDDKGVVLQRSRDLDAVKDKVRQEFRPCWQTSTLIKEDEGEINVKDLVKMFYSKLHT